MYSVFIFGQYSKNKYIHIDQLDPMLMLLTKFDLDDDRGEEEEERGKRGCILLTAMH